MFRTIITGRRKRLLFRDFLDFVAYYSYTHTMDVSEEEKCGYTTQFMVYLKGKLRVTIFTLSPERQRTLLQGMEIFLKEIIISTQRKLLVVEIVIGQSGFRRSCIILGIRCNRDRSLRLIGLNQSAYIDKILKKFNMQNSKKGFIPMEVKHDLSNEMCIGCTKASMWRCSQNWSVSVQSTESADTELDVYQVSDDAVLWQCDKDDTKSKVRVMSLLSREVAVDWLKVCHEADTIAMHLRHNLSTWLRQKLQWKQFG
ncbi:hypothetical protein Tco_0366477 [Tanacetum coccineum]